MLIPFPGDPFMRALARLHIDGFLNPWSDELRDGALRRARFADHLRQHTPRALLITECAGDAWRLHQRGLARGILCFPAIPLVTMSRGSSTETQPPLELYKWAIALAQWHSDVPLTTGGSKGEYIRRETRGGVSH